MFRSLPVEVPALARQHFDTANWRSNLDTAVRQYKKEFVDKGDIRPLYVLVGAMFAFNFVYTLPREMAHNSQTEKARFHVH
jgi:uncharacterized membrane protein YesL